MFWSSGWSWKRQIAPPAPHEGVRRPGGTVGDGTAEDDEGLFLEVAEEVRDLGASFPEVPHFLV